MVSLYNRSRRDLCPCGNAIVGVRLLMVTLNGKSYSCRMTDCALSVAPLTQNGGNNATSS